MKPELKIKRVYAPVDPDDGYRILVDRLWPRGKTRAEVAIDRWAKGIAPSTALRKSWNHDAAHFEEFAQMYRHELAENAGVDDFLELLATQERVTLLYAARNEQANHAMVLRDFLREQLAQ
ncbi:DUF488 domain-containing protein [Glutamicibacter endophyticus]|uniref:DUF488 domain-containing protein n=1 Tax=Glutamicibacter sp. PS TaxID=3075634 RepID=UPI002844D70B|nr:DUF488 family protein [Glutamicibacter sp. PS]MDR4533267.1 DUF488 family protein [Glutamicibacter sp. PS]